MGFLYTTLSLLTLFGVSCSRETEQSPVRRAVPEVLQLQAMPAETTFLMGVQVSQVTGEMRATAAHWLGSRPEMRAMQSLFHQCDIDIDKNVDALYLAAKSADEFALLLEGRFDANAALGCLSGIVSAQGGEMQKVPAAIRIRAKEATQAAWLATASAHGLLFATNQAWLAKARDPELPKVQSRKDLAAMIQDVEPGHAAWLVSRFGDDAPELAPGAKPTAAGVSIDCEKGVALNGQLQFESASAAQAFVDQSHQNRPMLGAWAQSQGIRDLVSTLELKQDGSAARGSLHIDAAELEQLSAQLTSKHPMEGARQ